MLAARDQENLVLSRQAGAAKSLGQGSKPMQAKTPGARYPKTPLKVPLNDENATTVLGKSVLGGRTKLAGNENIRTAGKGGKGMDKSALATPLEPRTGRAPLGNKTTNAKARTMQATGVKSMVREIEKSVPPPTVSHRPRAKSPRTEGSKMEVLTDVAQPLGEEDVEYAPPRPKDLPYQSDVFPDGALTFKGLRPENRLKGYYQYYYDPVGDDGVSLKDKQFAEAQRLAFEEGERRIKQDLDDFDWTVGDVPATANYFAHKGSRAPAEVAAAAKQAPRAPSTLTSRRAASALALAPKPAEGLKAAAAKPSSKPSRPLPFGVPSRRPAQPAPRSRDLPADKITAVSRSTLGYSKGRTASSMINGQVKPVASGTGRPRVPRSASAASTASDMTITPSRYAQGQAKKDTDVSKRLEFLSIFDVDEDDDGNLGGSPELIPDCDDDDFKVTTDF